MSTSMDKKISRYIILLCSSLLIAIAPAHGQIRDLKFKTESDTLPLLMGGQAFFNLAGVVLWQASSYGEIEGGLRINMKGKYFPTIEAGLGLCDKTDEQTDLHCKANAPFLRLGCDYNFARNKAGHNRIYGGIRMAYTTYKYDLDGPTLHDPYWQDQQMPLHFSGLSSNALWAEFVFGIETKVWRNFHVGWTARYKNRIHQKENEVGQSFYIPGYGKNGGHRFTGTFNLVFDLGRNLAVSKDKE